MIKKTLFKIIAIITLLGGLSFIVLALIALFSGNSNTSTTYSLIAAPFMFLGVFLFTLGFGKDKNVEK